MFYKIKILYHDAAIKMIDKKVGALPVIDSQDKIVGIRIRKRFCNAYGWCFN